MALVLLLSAERGAANGRFPAAGQVVFNPSNPDHLVAVTTLGLAESRDGGESFSWICESVMGLTGTVDPSVAITQSGVLVSTNYTTGVVRSEDGCSFTAVTAWSSVVVPDLSLSRSAPRELFSLRASVVGGDQFESTIVHSIDEGRTWQDVGSLPEAFLPLTVDVAPSEPERVYVSARVGSQEDYVSVLFRSDDGGVSFARAATLPETENLRLAFIGGVHPTNPDLLYVRVDHPDGTRLWRSDDGGASVELVFTAVGALLGFALSEDEVAFGGPMDGLWVGDPRAEAFERRADVGPLCLAYGPEGLYACADAATDGFTLGRSDDSGQSFEPLLELALLCGPTACSSETQVGVQCPFEWNEVARRLGTTCGVAASNSSGTGGEQGASGSSQAGASRSSGSCTLGRRAAPGRSAPLWGIVLLCSVFVARRELTRV
jgi:hypothetical protein